MGRGREGARQSIAGKRKSWQIVYWPITRDGCGRGREGEAREGKKKVENLVKVACECFLLIAHLGQSSGAKLAIDGSSG